MPPIEHWNKQLSFAKHQSAEVDAAPRIKVEMMDGAVIEEEIKSWKDEQIVAWLTQINSGKTDAKAASQ